MPGFVDVALAGALYTAVASELAILGAASPAAPLWLQVLLAATTTLPLVLRRRAPVTVLVAVSTALAAQAIAYEPPEVLAEPVAVIVTVYAITAYAPLRTAVVGSLYAAVCYDVHGTLLPGYDVPDALIDTVWFVPGFVLGRLVHRKEDQVTSSDERAGRLRLSSVSWRNRRFSMSDTGSPGTSTTSLRTASA
jgi:hypothetical protein